MKDKRLDIHIARVLLCVALILRAEFAIGKPLDPEDVESLLPATPQTKNDTVAAIVQDPVVKNAVNMAVKNGSLSGLVVKKNVVIIPASAPDQVLSQRQQVLVAPVTDLEDIRKNITEGQQAEDDSQDIDEIETSPIVYQNELTTSDEMDYELNVEENERPGPKMIVSYHAAADSTRNPANFPTVVLPQIKPAVTLPDTVTGKIDLAALTSNATVAVPVVAVLDLSKSLDKKIESSILALLPTGMTHEDVRTSLNYLEKNRGQIEKDVRKFADENRMSVEATSWKTSTPAESLSRKDERPTARSNVFEAIYVAPGILPQQLDADDMDVAEDMIFRPLFLFRQEAQERRASYQSGAYRRSSYKDTRPYYSNSYDFYRRPYYRSRSRNYNYGDY